MKVNCLVCGKELNVKPSHIKNGEGKYCSKPCMSKAKTKLVTRTCEGCNREFKAYPAEVKRGGGKYCSRNCYYEARKRQIIWRVCGVCGKEFSTQRCHISRGFGKYCSMTCSFKARVKQIKRNCAFCGKEIVVVPNQIANGGGIYCSHKCSASAHFGEKSCHWRGGISYEPYCPKFNNEFKERVRLFFDRRCLLCGKSEQENGNRLDVHHCDYDKDVCCNDRPPAFAALCHKHNSKVNFDRDQWAYIFHYIIDEIYNGKCYLTVKEYAIYNK